MLILLLALFSPLNMPNVSAFSPGFQEPVIEGFILDIGDDSLVELISTNSTGHYLNDVGCPLTWEPSGFDFLSPCLQV